MLTSFVISILLAWAGVFFLMCGIWWLSLRIRNAGIVDIAWAMGFAPIALGYALVNPGFGPRRILVTSMAGLWSLRLGSYLWRRVMGHHPEEDRRYRQLRLEWGDQANRKMFWFFQLQAVLMVVLSVPFLLACLNPRPALGFWEWTGLAIWVVAWLGESLADRQLKQFKADPAKRGMVCQSGLWYYSRHPNYFFEWLVWVSFFIFALGSSVGWVTIYCPLLMLFFLLKVTGIPMTEELAVKTKGEAYREYQRTTNAFVPWFRKTN